MILHVRDGVLKWMENIRAKNKNYYSSECVFLCVSDVVITHHFRFFRLVISYFYDFLLTLNMHSTKPQYR